MRAALKAAPLVEAEDRIHALRQRQFVRNHDDRFPLGFQFLHLFEELRLVDRVQKIGRLVENVNIGVLEERAHEVQPLPLAAGQLIPVVADDVVEAAGEVHDLVVEPELLAERDDLGLRGGVDRRELLLPVPRLDVLALVDLLVVAREVRRADVVQDRVVVKVVVLGTDADVVPERELEVADVLPVEQDLPLARVEEPVDEVDQRGFADPARARDQQTLAAADPEVQVFDALLSPRSRSSRRTDRCPRTRCRRWRTETPRRSPSRRPGS